MDSPTLLVACGKIDEVNECCNQVFQNAISDAAREIALKDYGNSSLHGPHVLSKQFTMIDDCKSIVFQWLTVSVDPSSMNSVLRGLSSCSENKVCPLVLPNMRNVTKECGNVISNQTACSNATESYGPCLQEQSLITNLQALNYAAF
ncbi:putative GPI-anchored protein [Camellia lanceoleosa]|uniref:GPI-anchored protein n=1 Tax=Camellia lanceoleosa TaxID=1840588 RepID=A0ACC0G6K1_9ERIC|nr:putative GPI-anchored protein [Camellia lanceoleosa]